MSLPLHVVIVDDRSHFALHVWRYLARSIGFGIGDVTYSDGNFNLAGSFNETESESLQRAPLWSRPTPAGDAVVWWVNLGKLAKGTGTNWRKLLEVACKQARPEARPMFLVDVRGEGSGSEGEIWQEVFKTLERFDVALTEKDVWLVSSYGVGMRSFLVRGKSEPQAFPIKPKSAETLQTLARRIWPEREGAAGRGAPQGSPSLVRKTPSERAEGTAPLHILITGAGFEIESRERPDIGLLGMPLTKELLGRAYVEPIWQQICEPGAPSRHATSFPYPNFKVSEYKERARGPASDADLDRLWDVLLQVLLEEVSTQKRAEPSSVRKTAMLDAERQARESFRSSLLGYDWGLLTQALDAAALPWSVWLTTNYTHFVDRAVALLSESSDPMIKILAPWRIFSIATEAEQLLRRLFFERRWDGLSTSERFLFKLHGDLSHLATMAIAGHDKELFTPLTQAVGSLHWLYEAAGRWIQRLIEGLAGSLKDRDPKAKARVCWTVVGHGLKDEVLVRTIEGVLEATSNPRVEHSFVWVQPQARKEFGELAHAPWGTKSWGEAVCHIQDYRADQWLAMLWKFYRRQGRVWHPGCEVEDLQLQEAVRLAVDSRT